MSKWFVDANGAYFGEYEVTSEWEALEKYEEDSGYEPSSEVYAYEIDVEALFSEVAKAAGTAVFQDSYGDGVALIADKSFKSLKELAQAYDLEIWDFTR